MSQIFCVNFHRENQLARVSNSAEATALLCLFLSTDKELEVQGILHLLTHVWRSTIVLEIFLFLLNAISLLTDKKL
jgi:hypothetical protein